MGNTKPNPTPATLDDLLGKPPLIKGEDEAAYRRLLEAIAHEMQPQTLLEKISVKELVDSIWDQRRHKDSIAALVEIEFISALASLLRHRMPRPPPDCSSIETLEAEDRASLLAKEYFDGNTTAKQRNELTLLFRRYDITEEQIRARAMEHCSVSIQLFKRMKENDDKIIRRALKEHARRLAELAK